MSLPFELSGKLMWLIERVPSLWQHLYGTCNFIMGRDMKSSNINRQWEFYHWGSFPLRSLIIEQTSDLQTVRYVIFDRKQIFAWKCFYFFPQKVQCSFNLYIPYCSFVVPSGLLFSLVPQCCNSETTHLSSGSHFWEGDFLPLSKRALTAFSAVYCMEFEKGPIIHINTHHCHIVYDWTVIV